MTPGDSEGDSGDSDDTGDGGMGGGAADTGDDSGPPPPIKFDAGSIPDGTDGGFCGAPSPVVCDDMDDDPWHAIGLNCPGGPSVDGSITGHDDAFYVHEGNIGTYMPAPYPPREGNKVLIMSSGVASDLLESGVYASTAHTGNDPGSLPAPIVPSDVGAMTCADNPDLVGNGDCSNTIEEQWSQGTGANDYAELRFTVTVPDNTFGFSYDFAMFSTEYPVFYQSSYNDMYIAWLESEQWTGNVSFDEMGNPISLNAGFLDYKDAPNDVDCPDPCTAPELEGTAMEGHAGTKWLTTTAPVQPGEDIEVVFAIFDLTDNILDTIVVLDNWQWNCDGGPPVTIPG
jgi:hypothetical protein